MVSYCGEGRLQLLQERMGTACLCVRSKSASRKKRAFAVCGLFPYCGWSLGNGMEQGRSKGLWLAPYWLWPWSYRAALPMGEDCVGAAAFLLGLDLFCFLSIVSLWQIVWEWRYYFVFSRAYGRTRQLETPPPPFPAAPSHALDILMKATFITIPIGNQIHPEGQGRQSSLGLPFRLSSTLWL